MDEVMLRISAYLAMSGERFSPSSAERKFRLDFGLHKNEPGDIGVRGKYSRKPIPYGAARWELLIDESNVGLLLTSTPLFDVPGLANVLASCGATDVVLHVDCGYWSQCNLEFDVALLQAIARLSVPLAVSCYRIDGE